MHVIIIGAGCTGLLVAQGLKKSGISCTVYERSLKDRRFRDWSMMLHWGGRHLEQTLPKDIAKRTFKECDVDTCLDPFPYDDSYHPVFNGKTGEVVVDLPWPPLRRYSRARAVNLFAEGIDIRNGMTLIDIVVKENGVEAIFDDGSTSFGDILIGADSANSFTRSWLFDHSDSAKCSDLPLIAYNFTTSYPPELAKQVRNTPHRMQRLTVHPDHSTWYLILSLQVDEGQSPEEWVFQTFFTHWSEEPTPSTPEERLKHFKALGATYAEPFRSAALSLDEKTILLPDRLKYWAEPKLWDNRGGRVTLAGDAAHPFPPHRGQGLNNSFHDAANLVKGLCQASPGNLKASIDAYDIEVFERGSKEIEVSCKQAYAATHFDVFLESAAVTHGVKPVPRENGNAS